MSKPKIISARQGHDRLAGRWEKQAKRDGKGSEAYRRYSHHISEWLRLTEQLKATQ